MEAPQSSPPCAHVGLLLLLLVGLGCSPLPEVQGKPNDFWCKVQHRIDMRNRTVNREEITAACVDSDTLPVPIQLPCVSIQVAAWANQTVQQKSAEVMGALQVSQEGVERAKRQISSAACWKLLSRLEKGIRNYIAIVKNVYEQNGTSQATVDRCSSVNSLEKVLDQFGRLLRGKLEDLALDVKDSMCDGDQRTFNGS